MTTLATKQRAGTETPAFKFGYTDGYRGAIDALANILCDSSVGAEVAMRRADDHLITCLYDWRTVGGAGTPPQCGQHGVSAQQAQGKGNAVGSDQVTPFARGYMAGWDEALDHFGRLVFGYHAPSFTAIDVMRDHVSDHLMPWLASIDHGDARPPILCLPCFLRGSGIPASPVEPFRSPR